MKIKTTELQGPSLDWAVALAIATSIENEAVGITDWVRRSIPSWLVKNPAKPNDELPAIGGSPSTDWSQGMPILDRAGICVRAIRKPGHALDGTYMAMEARRLGTGSSPLWSEVCWPENKPGSNEPPRIRWDGPAHLIAGLRCYVGITLGDEVEVPDELIA